jgi:photosystem II stability/assembly factor-like uncharacterized protein
MNAKKIIILLILILFYSFCYSQDYWESIYSSGSGINCLAINSIGYLFAGTQNGIYRSVDNGVNWDNILDTFAIGSIEINSQDDIYSSPGPIYFSTDYGDNWETLNYPEMSISHIFVDSQNNILVGFWGGIYKSNNNGLNWELVLSFSNCEVVNSIVENSEGVLFAGTINFFGVGGVYRSTDQGDSWEHIGLENEYISSLAINSNDEIFAGSRGHHYEGIGGVFRSSDNGETWTELCDDALVTSIAIDSEDKIFIGCSFLYYGAVLVSEDNGENWQLIESDLIDIYTSIEFLLISEDDYVYAISCENINHIYRSVQSTGEIHDYTIQEIKNIKLNNYPNPFNPSGAGRSPTTTISFSVTQNAMSGSDGSSFVTLEIYNIKGQKVKTLVNESIPAGEHSIIWDGDNDSGNLVSSGIYLYKLSVNGKTEAVKKCLLLK